MNHADSTEPQITALAATVQRLGLTTPVRICLDALIPVGFLASQCALFLRPLTPIATWRESLRVFEDEQSWATLRQALEMYDRP